MQKYQGVSFLLRWLKSIHHVWEEIFILLLLLCSVHSFKMFLCETVGETLLDLVVLTLCWLDDSHHKGWRYSEPQNSVNESSHDLHVDQSLEELLEVVLTLLKNIVIALSHVSFELRNQVFVGLVLLGIVVESL